MINIITGERIEIKGNIPRHEIVRKVVNHFINTEHNQKGAGIQFQYPVEKLPDETYLMIGRPGHKKYFDFKVIIKPEYQLGSGSHEEIAEQFKLKANQVGKDLWKVVDEFYHCTESDVDELLSKKFVLKNLSNNGTNIEVLLKVLKWLFIMEDIVYWDNEGRAFLYNWLQYQCKETDNIRFQRARKDIKFKPTKLKKYLKELNLNWTQP